MTARTTLEVRLLGPVELADGITPVPVGGRRPRVALALLASAAGGVVSGDRLAEAIWGDDAADRARTTLQVHISNLRKALTSAGAGAGVLANTGDGYRLDTTQVGVDAARFEALVATGAAQAARGETGPAADTLEVALALWRGPFAADLLDVAELEGERSRLEEVRLGVEEDRAEAALALGRHGSTLAVLEAMCREHPLRERRWGLLMVARYRSGNQAGALAAYRQAREALVDELGIDPGQALQRLERSVLSQSDSLMVPEAAGTPALVWLDPAGAPRRLPLVPDRTPVRLGRESTQCDVVFDWDPTVSRLHAEVRHEGTAWLIADEGMSSNGTFLNGARIGAATALADGDLVRVGNTTLRARLPGAPERPRQAYGGETLLPPVT